MNPLSLLEKYAPGPLEVLMFTLGMYFFLASAGAVKSIPIGSIPLMSPQTRIGRLVYLAGGLVLVVVSVHLSLAKPVWKSAVSEELIYADTGGNEADEVVVDGEQIYVRTRRGNILRVTEASRPVVDPGTNTKQIVSAGGVLYALKHGGRILAVVLSVSGPVEYPLIDVGTDTRQIAAVGDGLYILKDDGKLWRAWTSFSEEPDAEATPKRKFTPLGPALAQTRQIASSGTALFALKDDGITHRYFPLPEGQGPRIRIMTECGHARAIAADAGTLYLIDQRSSKAFMCRSGGETLQRVLLNNQAVDYVDAYGGVAYVVTKEGAVWRHGIDQRGRELKEPERGGHQIRRIVASNQGCLIVKTDGSVWRLSESLRKL